VIGSGATAADAEPGRSRMMRARHGCRRSPTYFRTDATPSNSRDAAAVEVKRGMNHEMCGARFCRIRTHSPPPFSEPGAVKQECMRPSSAALGLIPISPRLPAAPRHWRSASRCAPDAESVPGIRAEGSPVVNEEIDSLPTAAILRNPAKRSTAGIIVTRRVSTQCAGHRCHIDGHGRSTLARSVHYRGMMSRASRTWPGCSDIPGELGRCDDSSRTSSAACLRQ